MMKVNPFLTFVVRRDGDLDFCGGHNTDADAQQELNNQATAIRRRGTGHPMISTRVIATVGVDIIVPVKSDPVREKAYGNLAPNDPAALQAASMGNVTDVSAAVLSALSEANASYAVQLARANDGHRQALQTAHQLGRLGVIAALVQKLDGQLYDELRPSTPGGVRLDGDAEQYDLGYRKGSNDRALALLSLLKTELARG